MSTNREKMELARSLIQQKRYDEARTILRTVNHDIALDWLDKIDHLDPPKIQPVMPGNTFEDPLDQILPKSNLPPNPMISQSEIDHARFQNYTNSAVIALILYFMLWIPGLIANILYLNDARQMEKLAGKKLPGTQTLKIELVIFGLLPPILVIVAIVATVILGGFVFSGNEAAFNTIAAPITTSNDFMTALIAKDYAKAYDMVIPDQQSAFGGSADGMQQLFSSKGIEPSSFTFTNINIGSDAVVNGTGTF